MNFFDDCYCIDGPMIGMDYDLPEDEVNQGAGSEAEMAALDGVQNLSLGGPESLDWQRLSDEWEAEPGSRQKQQPLRSEHMAGATAGVMLTDTAKSSHRVFPTGLPALQQPPPANMFHQASTNPVKQEPTEPMFTTEPTMACPTWFKTEPTQKATGLQQPLPEAASTASWFGAPRNAFGDIDFNGGPRADSKRSRSPTMQQVHLQPAAPRQIIFSEEALTPPSMTWQASKRTKSSNPSGRGVEQVYICGYCSRRKTSTSRCADGRVRIRCQCGGQHKDNKPRMHATWTLYQDSNSQSSSSGQNTAQEWIFVDEAAALGRTSTQHQQGAITSSAAQ